LKSTVIALVFSVALVLPVYGDDCTSYKHYSLQFEDACKKLNALAVRQDQILHNQKTIAEMLVLIAGGTNLNTEVYLTIQHLLREIK
jgi:hypothetical protein